jgi:hypothetical protein
MLKAALFSRKLSTHFDFLTFVFHFMLDPDPNPDPEPEPVSVTIRQKSCGSCGTVPVLNTSNSLALGGGGIQFL